MSSIAKLNQYEAEMKALQSKMENLKQDPALAKELAARDELHALMEKHGLNQRSLLSLLGVASAEAASDKPRQQRRPRALKAYINPHTNERLETKGGNHKGLKAWKEKHGAEEVESWAVKEAS